VVGSPQNKRRKISGEAVPNRQHESEGGKREDKHRPYWELLRLAQALIWYAHPYEPTTVGLCVQAPFKAPLPSNLIN
jgi:hypothetical protein